MDVLSEVLKVVKLESAIFFNCEFSAPWRFYSPKSMKAAPLLSPNAGHVIIYHLLCEGEAYVHLENGTQVLLRAGDVVTFPHGDAHHLGCGEGAELIDGGTALPQLLANGLELVRAGGGGECSRWICGFLACDAQLSQPFLAGLPPLVRVNIRDDASGSWLENSLRFSVNQAIRQEAGSQAMLAKLSEVLFTETLRRFISSLPAEETGWLAGARDPEVGKALGLLHGQPAHPWTIADLAQEVGLSRSVLADRFRFYLGEPPIAYLTRWRLRLGARSLTRSSSSVAEIAGEVGYESEASFNRAFKREFGLPPARYRQESRSQQHAASVAG